MFYKPKDSSLVATVRLSFGSRTILPDWARDDPAAKNIHRDLVLWLKIFEYASMLYVFMIIYLVFIE